jgi:2'-5' RNA ligase
VAVTEQLSLTGFAEATRPTERLFFAILPDAETATRIAQLARQLRSDHGLKGMPPANERLHITLYFLGDYVGLPQDLIAKASAAASSLAWPSFELSFDRAASFVGKRSGLPLVLRGDDGVSPLMDFRRALAATMIKAGFGRTAEAHFVPHVTLLYDDHRVTEQLVETIGWTAHEFVLVRSVLGQSRHIPLARWQLRG